MQSPHDQRDFILKVLAKTGLTQTELAKRAGLDPSTLSRFLGNASSAHELRASTIRQIEGLTGMALAGGDLADAKENPPDGFAEAEATPLTNPSGSQMSSAIQSLIGNRKNIDPWVMKSRSLELAGYKPGDVMLVALGETPLQGDVVCCQIYDWTKARAETVFRIFQPPYLIAATTEPELMKPWAITDDTVTVKGVVLHTIRSRPQN